MHKFLPGNPITCQTMSQEFLPELEKRKCLSFHFEPTSFQTDELNRDMFYTGLSRWWTSYWRGSISSTNTSQTNYVKLYLDYLQSLKISANVSDPFSPSMLPQKNSLGFQLGLNVLVPNGLLFDFHTGLVPSVGNAKWSFGSRMAIRFRGGRLGRSLYSKKMYLQNFIQ